MSQSSLTAKYRPQRFSEVAGQETLKGILSRAAAEDRIAPAYLFSGTRGVGKTTVARILAKAINCLNAPTEEPCNECAHCRQITQGMAVDVIEIDGASNRGIEDARRIREDIGYAPMECKYKVFIIDEAHMLTKEASNALLKTLEEPPGNVTFILATTEPHKILPTIISRCQHYSFKRLTMPGLVAHLENVLQQEQADYDPRAVQLIARRAAGSVRDSMSLLGQTLAMGRDRLEVEDVRAVLGLAGHEIFFRVLEAVEAKDPLGINALLRELLDQGLDLGFFLRELAQCWRNLFLLKQAGDKALPLLELTDEEAQQWLEWSSHFSLQHVHAAWQLTLEGQRRVLTSLEPALALELLLLNLAYLPSLVNLEQVAQPAGGAAPGGGAPGGARGGGASGPSGAPGGRYGASQGGQSPRPLPPRGAAAPQQTAVDGVSSNSQPQSSAPNSVEAGDAPPWKRPAPKQMAQPVTTAPVMEQAPEQAPEPMQDQMQEPAPQAEPETVRPNTARTYEKSWQGFMQAAEDMAKEDGQTPSRLRQAKGHYDCEENVLYFDCRSDVQRCMLLEGEYGKWLLRVARSCFGEEVRLEGNAPENKVMNRNECKDQLEDHPLVKQLQDEMDARIVDWGHTAPPTS